MYILYAKIKYKKMTITILFLIIKLFSPYGEYLLNKIIIGADIYEMVSSLSLLLIIVGFFIFIVGALGCCGACCSNRVLLVLVSITIQSTLSKWSPLLE
jgi:general stress protein CsbA